MAALENNVPSFKLPKCHFRSLQDEIQAQVVLYLLSFSGFLISLACEVSRAVAVANRHVSFGVYPFHSDGLTNTERVFEVQFCVHRVFRKGRHMSPLLLLELIYNQDVRDKEKKTGI
ncbi:hypothetical protein J6590_093839 [Homalodisca vitripennis]|nr:hypothetical protein J6590_093839 [Homalodisca vitripennis]